ncbi:MAG: PD-(D/E)XK nuclease family protein [bacterium]|nr:PD-(D/E)XK nuclease family protein [bacterium]
MSWGRYARKYEPGQTAVHKLSRSKLELFTQCPRCFWLNERLGIKRPSSPPFQINKAIDELFKKEFDAYRMRREPHPIMVEHKLDAIPYSHEQMDKWRHNFTGVTTLHKPTNLHIFGAVDDIWVDSGGKLIVVDYKATSKNKEITLDADWQITYKRQMEIYQWLLRQNGFEVNDTGYFVYANGRADLDKFDNRVEFVTKLIPYTGKADWVDDSIVKMKECLEGDMPEVGIAIMGGVCEHCEYAKKRTMLTLKHLGKA